MLQANMLPGHKGNTTERDLEKIKLANVQICTFPFLERLWPK